MLLVSDEWKRSWPKAHAGVMLLSGISPMAKSAPIKTKEDLLQEMRHRLPTVLTTELAARTPVKAYSAYHSRFAVPFDLCAALERQLAGEKNRSPVNPVLWAVFQASLENLLLTTCHDYNSFKKPLRLATASTGQKLMLFGKNQQELLPGDMIVSDSGGVIASALLGGDQSGKPHFDTQRVILLTIAPPGIDNRLICENFFSIYNSVRRFASQTEINYFQVW